ncbi:LAMI_0F03224g1_1 [Lachancea mirantina]|uniref:LAMI_0F03224g1_1 n=1 Tax=Lachancea mirantina TaxID=1230905 RepID=A0A1G4JX17_9SACH|nr:LAMI_0F03224g1_1 [Lachancea mirantina]
MAPPKKSVKMDLNSFLNDESFGESWAEEEVDLEKINIPINSVKPSNTIPLEGLTSMKGSRLDPALAPEKRERVEYPVPDYPPYRAMISNVPWDVSEEGIRAWVEDGLDKQGAVTELAAPRDFNEPSRLKGFAFVTFAERSDLEAALRFNATKLNERTVFVSVAAPQRGRGGDGGFEDINWESARGSNYQSGRPRGEEVDLDWGSMRGSAFQPARPRREEPDLDWGSMRGAQFRPQRERKPREDEPELDWGAMRGSQFQAQRERKPRAPEPELDWGAVRGANAPQRPIRTERKPRDEPQLDWGGARGSKFGQSAAPRRPAKQASQTVNAQESPKIQKSSFAVLSTEDDDETEQDKSETSQKATNPSSDDVEGLEKATANLSVHNDDGNWETVGKK